MALIGRFVAEVYLILWELPQTLLGFAVFLTQIPRQRKLELIHGRVFVRAQTFGISLGKFVFWSDRFNDPAGRRPSNKAHEYGHCIQSIIFGPLYLITIGIPSVSRGAYKLFMRRARGVHWPHYYNGYPEDWADRLGARYFRAERR